MPRYFACSRRLRTPFHAVVLLSALAMAGLAIGPGTAVAQQRSTPSQAYHAAFNNFNDGEYRDALDTFLSEGRGAIKNGQMRWIDSICYHTMSGECYYHMGQLPQALEHYTSALKLYVAFYNWMLRVQFPATIKPANPGAYRPTPWGTSRRRARMGSYPSSMLIGQGKIDLNDEVQHGGVVQQAMLFPIEVQEIVRCTALAIRRRATILGPVSPQDPLTLEVASALMRRPGPPNHWSEAWIDVQLGLALVAAGKGGQGVPYLTRSVVAAGEFDHPLTSTALLALGQLALMRNDYAAASSFFEEASYAAVHYPDAGVLEEAFRYGAIAHLMANRKGIFPPLEAAIAWSKRERLRQLHASLLLLAAENCAVMGQTGQAAKLLEEARLAIGRRQMGNGWIGGRLNFHRALVFYQERKLPEGDAALAAAMGYMQQGSHWLFHMSLVDNLYTGGAATARSSMDLFGVVLRDPQPADWAFDPMESMAALVTPHPLPLEHWFEAALQRKENDLAVEIADRARRHRFFSSLAFGGRLESLRWVLEAPADELDQISQLQRQDLLMRYSAYHNLTDQAKALRTKLQGQPLVVEDAGKDGFRQQSKDLAALTALSIQQEAILHEIGIRREPAGLVFPPLRPTQEIQKALPNKHALLIFFQTSRSLYAFLMNNQQYAFWEIKPASALTRQIIGLLHQTGQYQSNHELSLKDLNDDKWKQAAKQLLDQLLKDSRADFTKDFDELIIVPDGALWYLPFEMLQVEVEGQLRPLVSRFHVRYAPTASLAVPPRQPVHKRQEHTAVVAGKLYPRDDEAVARNAAEQIAKVLPGTAVLKTPLPAPSAIYGALFDRLIVLDDYSNLGETLPYRWSLVPLDRGRPGSTINDWMALPWGGPAEMILPGFHTAAEDSLKRLGRGMPGNEVFLSICGLMASGGRTLLVSRWRTGGQTSYDLVREFVQELPHTSPCDAWQRSILLAAGSRLSLDAEPRIKRSAGEEAPKATHPFFWAGYMLLDSGVPPEKPEVKPEAPVLKFKKPEEAAKK